jgi:hypothetical protein
LLVQGSDPGPHEAGRGKYACISLSVVNLLIPPFEFTKVRDVTFITSDEKVRVLPFKMERILGG